MSERNRALLAALGVTAAATAALSYAFSPVRAGKAQMLLAIGAVYAICTALGLLRLKKRGELREKSRPRGGDITIGALVAALLYGGAMVGHITLAPRGSPREAWLVHVYLQIGDPREIDIHLVGAAVFIVAALEELTWRGLVMELLAEPFGIQRAWLASTLLFAVAHLPTAYLLRDATAGYNPLLVAAGLGCSFVWGYLYMRTGRLLPAVLAHAIFSWSLVEFPVWRPYIER